MHRQCTTPTTNGSSNGDGNFRQFPKDVGIVNIEFYSPAEYVDQAELEVFHGVSPGKYQVGLGQTRMAITSDHEDIHSLCLTVTKRLMEKAAISPKEVGFLMVGTETLLDKSKSIKTVLMQLFEEAQNFDIQGLDTTNACFGGTASLHSAVDWIESSSWDGRYAIVVCGDIAVYAEGPARPTGGAGAVAMLVGPNAPLVFDRGVRTHYIKNAYDFYKPNFSSEYPVVDGKLSISCYMEAAYYSYSLFRQKFAHSTGEAVTIDSFDGLVFHAPYCKLTQKALARIAFNDFKSDSNPDYNGKYKGCEQFKDRTVEDTVFDKDFETTFVKVTSEAYEKKLKPCLFAATEVGNMYTASIYSCLVSYLNSKTPKEMAGKRILAFSYGSGMASSMFSLKVSTDASPGSALETIHLNAKECLSKLSQRVKLTPEEFTRRLHEREKYYLKYPFTPTESLDVLFPGTYHLTQVDAESRRFYQRKPLKSV